MARPNLKSIAALVGIFLLVWLSLKYLLPITLPFLLGGILAFSAEPLVRLLEKRLRFPRTAAAGIGVTVTLLLLSCVLFLLAALLVRELGILAGALPDLSETAMQGLTSVKNFLLELAQRAPEGIRTILTNTVTGLFSGSTAVVDEISRRLPALASAIFSHVPGSALTIGTGILSGFMLSARLPRLRDWLKKRSVTAWLQQYRSALTGIRRALGGWLKAQLKLSGMSFLIVAAGLLLLRIPYAPIWALLTALVDAIPVLGTGTVLLPWALICLIQGQQFQALGLLGIYVVVTLARSALEPRLVGKQLGIDPLMTLAALYIGYRIWGFGGMLLSPMLCVAAMEVTRAQP